MSTDINAKRFVEKLKTYQSAEELKKYHRYFKFDEGQAGKADRFIGVRMGQVFALAKESIDMPPSEIEKLMPRVALRYSIERFGQEQRDHYFSMKKVV